MNLNHNFFNQRRAGILLHPTSLPATPGNGDLGQHAYKFVDFLADCGISIWQMLPLGPTHHDLSPYQCQSVHAANPLLISLELLVAKGWLNQDSSPSTETELELELKRLTAHGWINPDPKQQELEHLLSLWSFSEDFCISDNHDVATRYRYARLKEARASFHNHASEDDHAAFREFVKTQSYWLDNYALFRALQVEHLKTRKAKCLKALEEIHSHNALKERLIELGKHSGWWEWQADLRDCEPQALAAARERNKEVIEQHRFEQFVFFNQWHDLKHYANEKGIYLFGDIPIFVARDSVDVWADRENFLLDEQGNPTVVTGVPPDYFSETGQRWGNPHYNWDKMQADGFQWWLERFRITSLMFDVVRIDHFRGFEASWFIQSSCETAIDGEWVKVPGDALFETLQRSDIHLPLVAEDLGIITDEVRHLRDKFGLPGMKILQFAFDGDSNNGYLPHNHIEHCVVYTGTHDNNTTLGWYHELPHHLQHYVNEYLHANPHDMPWPMVEAAFASVAQLAIVPMQDVLCLDGEHRMNVPSVETGNWRWRFDWSQLPPGVHDRLRHLVHFYGRV